MAMDEESAATAARDWSFMREPSSVYREWDGSMIGEKLYWAFEPGG
jgi:hypothetical protein